MANPQNAEDLVDLLKEIALEAVEDIDLENKVQEAIDNFDFNLKNTVNEEVNKFNFDLEVKNALERQLNTPKFQDELVNLFFSALAKKIKRDFTNNLNFSFSGFLNDS